jgi:peptide/nickel transport system permease protein
MTISSHHSYSGPWRAGWQRLRRDRVGLFSLFVVLGCLLLVAAVALGWVGRDWGKEVAVPDAAPAFLASGQTLPQSQEAALPPTTDISAIDPLQPKLAEIEQRTRELSTTETARANTLALGADRWGRSVANKALQGAMISISVGLAAALMATLIGTLLGAVSGYFGGWVDDVLEWVYNVFTAIPGILLIFAFAAVFGRGLLTVVLILGLAGWTGIYRLMRAEYLKHRERDYVRAARALGATHTARLFQHILPNVSHVILVQFALLVVGFIKAEVVLSFLGLGVPVDSVSWGTMLAEAQTELVLGRWWQLAAATGGMAIFITALSLLTDALRDALDPKMSHGDPS